MVQFFAQTGAFLSVLFRNQVQLKEMGLNQVNPSGYRYIDAGFSAGIGAKGYITPRLSIALEAVNNTGFLPMIKNMQTKKQQFKNNATHFLISVAYSFIEWKQKRLIK